MRAHLCHRTYFSVPPMSIAIRCSVNALKKQPLKHPFLTLDSLRYLRTTHLRAEWKTASGSPSLLNHAQLSRNRHAILKGGCCHSSGIFRADILIQKQGSPLSPPPPKIESLSIAPTLQPNLLATGKKGGQNISLIINLRPLFEVLNIWILLPCSSVFYGLVFKNRFFTVQERGINHQSKNNLYSLSKALATCFGLIISSSGPYTRMGKNFPPYSLRLCHDF